MNRFEKRMQTLEQRSGKRPLFVQFERATPGPRQLVHGEPVDAQAFARRLASAGPAAVVLKVRYTEAEGTT